MKVNKEVSDLTRKLDYIGVGMKQRREIIKECLNPLRKIIFEINPWVETINYSYECLKQKLDELEKERIE